MPKKTSKLKTKPLGKGQSARSSDLPLMAIQDNFTFIDLSKLQRRYRIQYNRVHNLQFRLDQLKNVQTFRQYSDLFKGILLLGLDASIQTRPTFSNNERYLRTKSSRHYPNGDVLVMVNSSIYPAVQAAIGEYVKDLAYDGYWASIYTVNGGTPSQMRAFIKSKSPVGVVMVGALPVPWFEMSDDFHGASDFPCDLYYMDTNGSWTDSDADGKFNGHSGNLSPEIWIGRIWTPTLNGNDTAMINDYFQRNHLFRLGRLGHSRAGLSYVDDDWQGFGDCGLSGALPAASITTYTTPDVTDADLYKSEVNSLRAWVQVCVHSWTHGHSFHVSTGNESVDSTYFRDINPPNAHFYNLFCCGPGRFTQDDYLAGWYIFNKAGISRNNGLVAVASAKTGSMLFFEDFYDPMGSGKVIGDAFVDWWKARGPEHDLGERQWHYGMVLLGDPTLNWWKGVVPQLQAPADGDVFSHWPRRIELRWQPVEITGARYEVEVDYFDTAWGAESGRASTHYHNLIATSVIHNFVGMQPGRWRVRAIISGRPCAWSPWSYFRFTV